VSTLAQQHDLIDRISEYESAGDTYDDEEFLELFQDLVATGMIAHLQGSYQRIAHALISVGAIKAEG